MTNLAEVLVQSAGVPFREAHEFASHLTDFGRERGVKPTEIAYAQAVSLYGSALPLTEAELARALDPRHIIATRRGRGGPQPREVQRMLGEAADALRAHQDWLAEQQRTLAQAAAAFDAFAIRSAERWLKSCTSRPGAVTRIWLRPAGTKVIE